MAATAEEVEVCNVDYTENRALGSRRHTIRVSSSLASSVARSPVVWRPVMPRGRRSILVASTSDNMMRTSRSISDATTPSHHIPKSTFALHDVDAISVQRAQEIRNVNHERFERICTFFISSEPALAMEIQARSDSSRDQVFAWINYIVSPKVLHCIKSTGDSLQDVLDLVKVSAAISKYGESELIAKDRMGDLWCLRNFQSSAMDFILLMNERLAEENRVDKVILCDLLTHAYTMTMEKEDFEVIGDDDQSKALVMRIQSEWFQDAMVKANGRHLYDLIRERLSSANDSSWDASKDKLELRRDRLERVSLKDLHVENEAANECQRRPRRPPPPPPCREAAKTVVSSPTSIDTKPEFSVPDRSSSLPLIESQELNVEMDPMRRKLLPLGKIGRSRGFLQRCVNGKRK